MGCGESKHAVATAEPIKKSSASRSNSRRMDKNLDQKDTVKTKTMAAAACSSPVEDEIEKSNGLIATDDTVVEKPVVAAKTEVGSGGDVKEEEKKTVVVVGHERTMSKGSPGTDYYSEEAKSEYESPQHDVVFAVKEGRESKNEGNGVAIKVEKKMEGVKERIKGGGMKDERKTELGEGDMQEHMKTEGNNQGEKDRAAMTNEGKQGESEIAITVVGEAEKDEPAIAVTEKEKEKKEKAKEQVVSKESRTIEEQVAEENIKEAMRGITL